MTPAASLGGGDVSGALLLDAATPELRAATFELVPALGEELPDTELETRYGMTPDGRPVTVETEPRYRRCGRCAWRGGRTRGGWSACASRHERCTGMQMLVMQRARWR